jgi:uncharacterized BrkB/YihY/UPF0761 family membrane protein
VIVLLVWLYVTNLALLIGALFNRELWRARERPKPKRRKASRAKPKTTAAKKGGGSKK